MNTERSPDFRGTASTGTNIITNIDGQTASITSIQGSFGMNPSPIQTPFAMHFPPHLPDAAGPTPPPPPPLSSPCAPTHFARHFACRPSRYWCNLDSLQTSAAVAYVIKSATPAPVSDIDSQQLPGFYVPMDPPSSNPLRFRFAKNHKAFHLPHRSAQFYAGQPSIGAVPVCQNCTPTSAG